MKLLLSFFLSLFIYVALIFFFFYFVFYMKKQERVEEVYIHQAVIVEKKRKENISQIKQEKKVIKQEVKKENIKKEIKKEEVIEKPIKQEIKNSVEKSEDTFSKGGKDIKFDDIFSNTPDNIPTKKVEIKKKKEMTKKKGNSEEFSKLVKKELSKLQSTIAIVSDSDKKSSDYISNEFEKAWAKIDTEDGNFVTLNVEIKDGKLNIFVISTNLDTILLNKFLDELRKVDIAKIKEFHGKITFNTKLKGK